MGIGETLGVFFGFVYGCFLLAVYAWTLFFAWRHYGKRPFSKFHSVLVMRTLIAGSICVGALALLAPIDLILRLTLALALVILHAVPSVSGFWLGVQEFAKADAEDRLVRTNQWLMEWDETAPAEPSDRDLS